MRAFSIYRLREGLKLAGLRGLDVAERLHVRTATVSAWLNGHSAPRAEHLRALCELLECKADDLFEAERLDPVMALQAQFAAQAFGVPQFHIIEGGMRDAAPRKEPPRRFDPETSDRKPGNAEVHPPRNQVSDAVAASLPEQIVQLGARGEMLTGGDLHSALMQLAAQFMVNWISQSRAQDATLTESAEVVVKHHKPGR